MFGGGAIERDWCDGFSQRWKGDQQNGDRPKIKASKELFEGRKEQRWQEKKVCCKFSWLSGSNVTVRSWAVLYVHKIFWHWKRPKAFPTLGSETRPIIVPGSYVWAEFQRQKRRWRLFSFAPSSWLIGRSFVFVHLSLMQLLFSAAFLSVNSFNRSCQQYFTCAK